MTRDEAEKLLAEYERALLDDAREDSDSSNACVRVRWRRVRDALTDGSKSWSGVDADRIDDALCEVMTYIDSGLPKSARESLKRALEIVRGLRPVPEDQREIRGCRSCPKEWLDDVDGPCPFCRHPETEVRTSFFAKYKSEPPKPCTCGAPNGFRHLGDCPLAEPQSSEGGSDA